MRALPIAIALAIYAPFAIHIPIAAAAVEDDLRDGDKYFEDGDYKKAAAAYDRAINSSPGQVSAEAYGKRAAIFIILKDYKGGLEFVDRAKRQYPNAPEVLEQQALMLWQTNSKDEAIKVAEQVVKSRPQTFSNQLLIGEYYYGRDAMKTATAFEAYLANRPAEREGTDVLPRIRLGFSYLTIARSALGDGDEARTRTLYQKATEQFEFVQRKLGKKPNAMTNSNNGLCASYTGLGRWDQAISVCERVIQNPNHIDSTGSVWFNLATAYLARKQVKKARFAGTEFTRMRKNEARGYMLLGDTYFQERDWNDALDQYLRAEKLLRPSQQRENVQLSIRLGKTYRRLPAPASGNNPNLALAIDKLQTAATANPNSVELAVELGEAYLDARQDAKATALTDRLLGGKVEDEQRASLLVISGRALYNQKKLDEARQRFEDAHKLRPSDVQIKRRLVYTINEQAFAEGKDFKTAQKLLDEALAIDPGSTMTVQNSAVLLLDHDDCDAAQRQLMKLGGMRAHDELATQRLLGRSYLCARRPDVKKAAAAFADAEREAKKASAQLPLAEIYTEWAPLIWDADVNEAVEKLETAVQISAQNAQIGPPAKRNLALALYRRGWKLMREGKAGDAANDFERATRDPNVLKGNEPLAFEFSFALAMLDSGRAAEAAKSLRTLANKGNQSSYLKGAYARAGIDFFLAYATSRSTTGAARENACKQLERQQGQIGGRAKELVAACFEAVAYDHWRGGSWSNATKALAEADKYAVGEQNRRLSVDRAAMSLGRDKLAELERLNGNPVEALVNLGIIYDMIGRPKEAYEAWTRAKSRGYNSRDLQKWIDAKKRIYGY